MSTMERIEEPQQEGSPGVATILAIDAANPPNCIYQDDYPNYYFRVTKSEHMTQLKEKFKRICEKTNTKKRYTHLIEYILEKNPSMCTYDAPSLKAHQEILVVEVPKLGKEAAMKAIEEWGQPKSQITHLIFTSIEGVAMPGADYQLTKLLGLSPCVKRIMLYFQGYYVGATALRLAKDIAENNAGSRVLVVSSCMTNTGASRGPSIDNLGCLVGQAIFREGAVALIIGANPYSSSEGPLFQIVSTEQAIIPDLEEIIGGHMREEGLNMYLSKNVPLMVSENIEKCLFEAFHPFGIMDWNSLFWVVHPGGSAILDQIEEKVGLKQEKLWGSRCVMSMYGNMGAPSVFFVLDETRRRSMEEGNCTTGEGLDWGVLFGFGTGLTVDTVVLHSFPYKQT